MVSQRIIEKKKYKKGGECPRYLLFCSFLLFLLFIDRSPPPILDMGRLGLPGRFLAQVYTRFHLSTITRSLVHLTQTAVALKYQHCLPPTKHSERVINMQCVQESVIRKKDSNEKAVFLSTHCTHRTKFC